MDEGIIKSIREVAQEKADDLLEFFYNVQKTLSPQKIAATINPLFLTNACISCFIDLERHSDFHKLEIADRHKKAAFLFKWLAKARPIALQAYKPGSGAGKAIHVNAYYGGIGRLDIDVHEFAKDTKIVPHIIYAGAYRDINAESWALTFCLLEKTFPVS